MRGWNFFSLVLEEMNYVQPLKSLGLLTGAVVVSRVEGTLPSSLHLRLVSLIRDGVGPFRGHGLGA